MIGTQDTRCGWRGLPFLAAVLLTMLLAACGNDGTPSRETDKASAESVARMAGLDAPVQNALREWLAVGEHKAFAVDPFEKNRFVASKNSPTVDEAVRTALPDGGFVLFAVDSKVVWNEELAKYLASPLGKGRGQYEDKQYADAAATLARAAETAKDDWFVQNRYGWALYMVGDNAGAVVTFRLAAELNPSSLGSWQGLMQALYANGDYALSVDAAEHGSKIAPLQIQKSTFALNAAYAYAAMGNYIKAAEFAANRPALGMQVQAGPQGLHVASVFKGGPADLAGVRKGDVLTRFNGQIVPNSLQEFIATRLDAGLFGHTVPFAVVRGGVTFAGDILVGLPADLPERYDASKALRAE